jgi:hypothetical protein
MFGEKSTGSFPLRCVIERPALRRLLSKRWAMLRESRMNPLKKFFLWLSGRTVPSPLPAPPLLPAPEHTTFIPHDPSLLERTRMQWMMGDWKGLAALDSATIEHHSERAKLAAYVGAGFQQLGQHSEAQRLLELAKEWGCTRKLLTELLLSGVYYTLARAALVAGDRTRALRNLKESIEVGMPGHDAVLVARARIGAQDQMAGAHLLDWGKVEEFSFLGLPEQEGAEDGQAQTIADLEDSAYEKD